MPKTGRSLIGLAAGSSSESALGSIAFDLQAMIEAASAPQPTRFAYAMKTLRNFTVNIAVSLDGAARSDLNLVSEELNTRWITVHIDHLFQHPG